MSISRLVTFGCSLTYGYGLSDCYLPNTNFDTNPSKQVYPALLGEEFNIPLLNESKPGCSNSYITHKILNYQFQKYDFVIVQWTSPLRSTLFLKDGELPIGPWIKEDYCKQYYTIVDYEHLMIETMKNLHHIELYLNSREIPFIFATNATNSGMYLTDKVGWNINTPIINFTKFYIDRALDKLHAGPESHKQIANHLSTILKEKYDTTN